MNVYMMPNELGFFAEPPVGRVLAYAKLRNFTSFHLFPSAIRFPRSSAAVPPFALAVAHSTSWRRKNGGNEQIMFNDYPLPEFLAHNMPRPMEDNLQIANSKEGSAISNCFAGLS
jgi:hypothetical protein